MHNLGLGQPSHDMCGVALAKVLQLQFITDIVLEDIIYLYWISESCHESMFAFCSSMKARWTGMGDLFMKARGVGVRDAGVRDARREVGVSQ